MTGRGLLAALAVTALAVVAVAPAAGAAPTHVTAKSKKHHKKKASISFVVGDEVDYQGGAKITVFGYDQPWVFDNQFAGTLLKAGDEFVTIDAQGCIGPSAKSPLDLNPFGFTLELPNHQRIQPGPGFRKPALDATPLQLGDCARGFITFEVPVGVRAAFVRFTPPGLGTTSAKWKVAAL